jgi:DNA-binding MarR family transcriptional regulator
MSTRIGKRSSRQPRTRASFSFADTLEVRDHCLCLFVQRAARTLARRFDEAFRPLRLTHGQFSLLTALNRPEPPIMRDVAALLGMDRTTLTAALKALVRRRLVEAIADADDNRSRRLVLTPRGRALLAAAFPLWKAAHAETQAALAAPARLRADLAQLALASTRGLRAVAPAASSPRRPKRQAAS